MRSGRVRLTFTAVAMVIAWTAPGGVVSAAGGDSPHGAFEADCSICHRPDAWKPASISRDFDHAKYGYRLQGAHERLGCRSCHASLDFKQTGSDCIDCHQDIHNGEMGTDCNRCHTTRNFIEQTELRRSHRMTRFPLTGAHTGVDCDSCHRTGGTGRLRFVNTQTECIACHESDYTATRNPDHVAMSFPRDCTECHSVIAWSGSRFNHSNTGFPLSGTHKSLDCSACHTGNQFQGASPDCYSCHQTDYEQSANPAHLPAGFSHDCQACHTTGAWRPSTFDHNTTAFPLTGAHRGAACTDCHVGGMYAGTPTACVSCHQQDYNATTNPDHSVLGFSTDCSMCHSTTTWIGATFDHDSSFFPIYSGAHAGRWSSCSTCHINPSNYGDFTCLSCHPHDDKNATDGHHSGVSGYAYISSACYSCHPRGTH